MRFEYRTRVARTSLALAFLTWTAAAPVALGAAPPPSRACPTPRPSAKPSEPLDALYSRRALRRVRTLMQLRLLELREARLRRVERAIERDLPPSSFIDPSPAPSPSPSRTPPSA